MKVVIFGLSISSSWGNGHATLWRGLCRALAARGHCIVFFERDVPYYEAHRDLRDWSDGKLHLYSEWREALPVIQHELSDADVGIITSYCPDGIIATDVLLESRTAARVFYDLDTPVTLGELRDGRSVSYIGPRGLRDFDMVLSFTGGEALGELQTRLGARRVAPLYGSVDPTVHYPTPACDGYRADLSYIGTYALDRQAALEAFFIEPARLLPDRRFVLAGAQYPQHFPWESNIYFVRHLPPREHAAFYSSSRLTLNITRRAMAEMGYCPQGRLFEAAACGAVVISDWWEGLDRFFEPGREMLVARTTEDVLAAIQRPEDELAAIAKRAQERALREHTAAQRAEELETIIEAVHRRAPPAHEADVVAGGDSFTRT